MPNILQCTKNQGFSYNAESYVSELPEQWFKVTDSS